MTTKINKVEQFLSELNTDIDILNYIDIEEVSDFDELFESIQENGGFDIEIIYYHKALKYLQENDPSLQESLGIASEYGYETDNLNSELLASLLASRDAVDDFFKLENEINEFFDNLK